METKIRLMEAKLRELEADNAPESSSSSSISTLPYHPSLPQKPPAQMPGIQQHQQSAANTPSLHFMPPPKPKVHQHAPMQMHPLPNKPTKAPAAPLPSLPILPITKPNSNAGMSGLGGGQTRGGKEPKSKLVGVVMKPKVKAKPVEQVVPEAPKEGAHPEMGETGT
jgi:hypothetical protein